LNTIRREIMLMITLHDIKNNCTVLYQKVGDNLTSTRFVYSLNCKISIFFKVLGKRQANALSLIQRQNW